MAVKINGEIQTGFLIEVDNQGRLCKLQAVEDEQNVATAYANKEQVIELITTLAKALAAME